MRKISIKIVSRCLFLVTFFLSACASEGLEPRISEPEKSKDPESEELKMSEAEEVKPVVFSEPPIRLSVPEGWTATEGELEDPDDLEEGWVWRVSKDTNSEVLDALALKYGLPKSVDGKIPNDFFQDGAEPLKDPEAKNLGYLIIKVSEPPWKDTHGNLADWNDTDDIEIYVKEHRSTSSYEAVEFAGFAGYKTTSDLIHASTLYDLLFQPGSRLYVDAGIADSNHQDQIEMILNSKEKQ